MMLRSWWTLCALGGLGFACSGFPETPDAARASRSAIVNGEPSDEQDDAVVKVIVPSEQALCSGTLVAPNLVVTALHCVATYNAFGVFSCDTKGVLVTSSPPDGELGAPVAAEGIEVHLGATPDSVADAYGKRVFGSGSQVICRNDIAFVVLDRDLDAPLAPLRRQQATVRNEVMRVVGYGQTEMPVSIGRHRRDGVLVTAVAPVGTTPGSGNAAPNTFVLGPGACQGDSGGPALDAETGALTGVYSLSAGISCEYEQIRNVYTNVAAFSSLVDRAFEFAGHTPIPEPGHAGNGSGGAGNGSTGGGAGTTGSSGSANASGGAHSGGSETSGGSSPQAGSSSSGGVMGEGSGSRRDSSCALKAPPGTISGIGGAMATIALMGLMALRRRR